MFSKFLKSIHTMSIVLYTHPPVHMNHTQMFKPESKESSLVSPIIISSILYHLSLLHSLHFIHFILFHFIHQQILSTLSLKHCLNLIISCYFHCYPLITGQDLLFPLPHAMCSFCGNNSRMK